MQIKLILTRQEKLKLIKHRYTIEEIKEVIGNIEKPPCILKDETWYERAVDSGDFELWFININSLDDLEQIKWRFEVLQQQEWKPFEPSKEQVAESARNYMEDLEIAEKLSHER